MNIYTSGTTAGGDNYNSTIYTGTTTGSTSSDNYIYWNGGTYTIPIDYIPATHTQLTNPSYYSNYDYETRIKQLEDKIAQLEAEKAAKIVPLVAWNVKDMLDAMRAHVKYYNQYGDKVELMIADDIRSGKYGFACPKTGCIWEIDIWTVKHMTQEMYINDGKATLVPDAFFTAEGKRLILEIINAK